MNETETEKAPPKKIKEMVRYGAFDRVGLLRRTGMCTRDDLAKQEPNTDKGEVEIREGNFTLQRKPPREGYRMRRRGAYPPIGDQLEAIADFARALRDQGIPLPDSTMDWLNDIDDVRARYPKGQD